MFRGSLFSFFGFYRVDFIVALGLIDIDLVVSCYLEGGVFWRPNYLVLIPLNYATESLLIVDVDNRDGLYVESYLRAGLKD